MMTTNKDADHKKAMPQTWSADHGGGVAASSTVEDSTPAEEKDGEQGIKPEDLTTENDQGAT
jgi:hypothetical protein